MLEVAGIGRSTRKRADGEEQEDLNGADPGDVGGGAVEVLDVVDLEDAEGVDVAPCVEDDDVGH